MHRADKQEPKAFEGQEDNFCPESQLQLQLTTSLSPDIARGISPDFEVFCSP